MSWDEVALRFGTDKASSFHDYMGQYERLLSGRTVNRLLEIGVSHGSSMFMWRELFPDAAAIVGMDILPECRLHQRIGIDVIIADAADPVKTAAVTMLHGPFDVVIDDGSHNEDDIRMAFEELYPRMARNGIYIIEDLHWDNPWVHEFAERWNGRVIGCVNGTLIVVEHL